MEIRIILGLFESGGVPQTWDGIWYFRYAYLTLKIDAKSENTDANSTQNTDDKIKAVGNEYDPDFNPMLEADVE